MFLSKFNPARCSFFRNDLGTGNTTVFAPITNGVNLVAASLGAAWGDYDNDGFVDLAVANSGTQDQSEFLYRNDGAGGMVRVNAPPLTSSGGRSQNRAWADYDGDGDLDLFVANYEGPDFLFHNERNGTFTRIYDGDIVNDTAYGGGAACADLDNDGFLDLLVSNNRPWDPIAGEPNFLCRNDAKANSNTNGWLLVRLVGTASNRSAIGAKIRAKATLWDKDVWQMREISVGGSWGQSDLRAHFGLGDAAQVDLLRIEWPSGIVQTLTNVAPKQILAITEHQAGVTNAPSMTASKSATGAVQLAATGQKDLRYVFEGSTELGQWTKLAVRTNLTGTVDFTPAASSFPQQFYRVVVP